MSIRLLRNLLFLLSLLAGAQAQAFDSAAGNSVQAIAVSALPPQARETLRLIGQGGPYPYARDGVVFGNYEKRLPPHARGYYHEYTVKTPGARNRGARRVVCGAPAECYYTSDHYRTFLRIVK